MEDLHVIAHIVEKCPSVTSQVGAGHHPIPALGHVLGHSRPLGHVEAPALRAVLGQGQGGVAGSANLVASLAHVHVAASSHTQTNWALQLLLHCRHHKGLGEIKDALK